MLRVLRLARSARIAPLLAALLWSSDGGHLNPAGSARAAGAMGWLMARVAGWSGP